MNSEGSIARAAYSYRKFHGLPNYLEENTGTEEYLKYGHASFQTVHNFNSKSQSI
jgi:hypothetical protein